MNGQASAPAEVFRVEDYARDPSAAIAYAAANGRAFVVDRDGNRVVVINILTKDLPMLDADE